MRLAFRLLLLTGLLAGCGKDSEKSAVTRAYPDLQASLEDARRESSKWLGDDGARARAVWDHVDGSAVWTATTLQELARSRATFESARDLEDFCPGYAGATPFQKDTCWLRLFSAMARFESELKPAATYLEATGTTSVGLLMMNPAHCLVANTLEKLQDPVLNIRCALHRFDVLAARDGWISGPGNSGAAAYWSVLRDPYQVGALYLGRKPHIQLFTRSYRGFREPLAP
jgi:hypothetical protein